MKRLLHLGNRRASTLIVAILLLPLLAWAQTEPTSEDSEPIYRFTTTMPEFPGSFNAYLAKTIQFPEDARAKGVSGTVLAEFVVEKDGRVNQVTIKVPLYPSCDEEVVRAIQGSPAGSLAPTSASLSDATSRCPSRLSTSRCIPRKLPMSL